MKETRYSTPKIDRSRLKRYQLLWKKWQGRYTGLTLAEDLALKLRYKNKWSYKHISTYMNMDTANLRHLIERAEAKLKKLDEFWLPERKPKLSL